MSMFCYQCEQASKGTGCTTKGVCGKEPETAALQDLLVHSLKGISMAAHMARELGASDPEINRFTLEALFTTVTNVNFDTARLSAMLARADALGDKAIALYVDACKKAGKEPQFTSRPES